MNFELPSLEERARVISRENRRASVKVNGIKSPLISINNITTTILYNIPLYYQETNYIKTIIDSLVTDERQAQTIVYGLPINADAEVVLNELSEIYGLEEMSRRHGYITQKLETLHSQSPGVISASNLVVPNFITF